MDIQQLFLQTAGKHFVAMQFSLTRGSETVNDYASCFVAELRGTWFLVTAGHLFIGEPRSLDRMVAAGYSICNVRLVDFAKLQPATVATAVAPYPLPITFDLEQWALLKDDERGHDFAALPLHPLYRDGLAAVGVLPIELDAICEAQFDDESTLVLVGVPGESYRQGQPTSHMKLFIVPLMPSEPTDEMPAHGESVLARLGPNPDSGEARLESVLGMSGCPVFRLITKAGMHKKYWAVGVQSGWHAPTRVVRFTPLADIAHFLADAVQKHRDRTGLGPESALVPGVG